MPESTWPTGEAIEPSSPEESSGGTGSSSVSPPSPAGQPARVMRSSAVSATDSTSSGATPEGQPTSTVAAPTQQASSGTFADPRNRWIWTAKRVLLREQLLKVTTKQLAAYYREAIRTLREGDDEIRYAIAGHALRELQNGLPGLLDVPEEKGRLGDFFGWLRDGWKTLIDGRPPKIGDQLWADVVIDRRLAAFLATLHDKIEFYSGVNPRRRVVHRSALGRLDRGLGEAPDSIQSAVVETWLGLSDVFNKATHSVNPDEFEAAVEAFEEFLIDRLAPKTFEKRDAIKALVQEAEGHANA